LTFRLPLLPSSERTRQVDEPRRGVLPTSTHLWLLTVCHSDTWWTVVPTKAAAVAETSTTTMKVVIWWIYQLIKLRFNLWVCLKTKVVDIVRGIWQEPWRLHRWARTLADDAWTGHEAVGWGCQCDDVPGGVQNHWTCLLWRSVVIDFCRSVSK